MPWPAIPSLADRDNMAGGQDELMSAQEFR
jgi:hypothetical protein